jgi:hypothetical protein
VKTSECGRGERSEVRVRLVGWVEFYDIDDNPCELVRSRETRSTLRLSQAFSGDMRRCAKLSTRILSIYVPMARVLMQIAMRARGASALPIKVVHRDGPIWLSNANDDAAKTRRVVLRRIVTARISLADWLLNSTTKFRPL